MSENNESKLVFDTLIGSDTLTRALENQLSIAGQLKEKLEIIKQSSTNAKGHLDAGGVSLVEISSLRTAVQLFKAMQQGAGALEKMSIGLGTKDLTTVEGILGAMSKLLGVTEKYSKLDNNKLQLKAFEGVLTEADVKAHAKNINAVKAINKGFAQAGDTSSNAAKLGIKLVEEHTKKLKQQAAEKNRIARQEAAESGDTRAYLKRRAAEGAITRTEISKAKTPEELKAIQSGITDRLHNPKLTKVQRARAEDLERMTQTKLVAHNVTPFETQSKGKFTQISDFQNLTPAQKAESKVGLSLLARRIATLKKEGGTYAQVVAAEALHQAARDLHATKFRPASAFQLREAESLRVAQAQPHLTSFSTLTNRGDVAQQLRMSSVRAKNLPEGVAKDAEVRYADALKAHGSTLTKIAKTQESISKSFIAEMQSKAQKGLFTRQDSKQITDLAQVAPLRKSLSQAVDDKTLTQSQRLVAAQARHELRLREIALKDALKVIDPVARASGLNRDAKNAALQSDPKHYNTATELGTRSIEQKTRQLNKAKELERVAASQYLTTQSLNGLSAEELTHAKKIINYRKNMAGANQQQADIELKLLSHIRSIERDTAEQARTARKLATHNQRMATDAGYRLAEQKKQLTASTELERRALANTANDRLNLKARNELQYKADIAAGTYATPSAIQALSTPQQFHDARASLNYQANNTPNKAEEGHARMLLGLLKEREALEKKSAANTSLIAQLEKTHYQTKASLNGLGREELQQAIAVLSYRRSIATTEQQRAAAQNLLNTANQGYKLNPEHQADNREAARTRILGDAGASVLTIQAGLMLNYKLLAGMQGLFSNAIGSVIELDSAFRQLQAISASTNTEMVSMKQNLILVAQASKFSAAEVGNTAVLLAQAGFSIGEISQSMKGIIALAQATGTDLGKSVDVVTSVLSVFNKGAGETDQVVNQLTEALNRSKLDINKMALGIQYAGNIAADSGITFEELTASLGAMANAGIRSGSTLGTGLRQMFIDLQKPSEKLKEKLSSLGLSLDQVDLKSYGLIGVLENLKNAGFTTGDAFKTFEVRAASAFAALSGNMDDFNQLKEGLNDTTAAFDANGVQLEALAVQLDHLKSNLGILSTEALMPVAALVRDLAKATAHAMEKTEEGSGTLQKFGTVLTGLTTAIAVGWMAKLAGELIYMTYAATRAVAVAGALRLGFIGLAASMSGGMTAIVPMAAALGTFAPILIGVVAGVGLVVAAFSAWSRETEKLNDKLDKAKAAFNKAKERTDSAKTSYDNVTEAISRLSEKYGVLNESQAATTDEAQSLVTKFGDMGFAIENVANVKISQLMQKLQELRKELGEDYSTSISDSFDATNKRIKAEDELARATLNQVDFAPDILASNARGLLSGKEGGARAQVIHAEFKTEPEVLKALSKFTEKFINVRQEGGLAKDLNFGAEKGKISKLLAKSSKDSYALEDVRKYIEEVLGKGYRAYKTRKDTPKKLEKAQDTYDSGTYAVTASDAATESGTASYEATQAQLGYAVVKAQINADTKLTLSQKIAKKALFAAKANETVQRQIKVYDNTIDPARERLKIFGDNGQSDSPDAKGLARRIKGWEDQRSALQADNKQINEDIAAGEALKSKGKLQDLQIQKEKLARELKVLKRESEDETGVAKQAGRYQLVENKQREIDTVENEITKLSAKKDADLAFQLQMKAIGQAAVLEDMKVQEQDKQKALKIAVSKRVTGIQSETENTRLEKYKQDQIDWVDANNLSDELFDKAQSAARKRAALQGKKVLNAGNMFKDINKDLAKAAQDAANATGQAQEYSSYGTGIGGFFARQAANAKNGVNEGKLKQEKLAREFLQLKASDDHYNALKLEETIPKAQAELAAKNVELKAVNDKLKQSNLSEAEAVADQKALIVEEIRAIEARLKTEQDLLKTSKEDRARHLATIEELKADLASMQDKTNVFKDSFDAGRQALDAGLGTIVNDWATQAIKNIDDVEQAFKAMGLSILQSMLKVVSDRTAMAFTNMLLGKADGSTGLGLVGQLGSAFFGNASSAAAGAAGIGNGAISLGLASGGFVNGNTPRHYATGGSVSGTDIGHDVVPAMLRPSEYVLNPSATSALGKPFLDKLNATTTGSLKQLEGKATAPQISVVQSPPTNVYVVSPDQKQQMTPRDVVVTISDDISRNGSIKKLIKSVISGEV